MLNSPKDIATYILNNIKPDSAGMNYGYLKKGGKLPGITFVIKSDKIPNIKEIQLTKRTRFFRADLEVYLELDNGDKLTLEAIDFDEKLFDSVFYGYFKNKELEKMQKEKDRLAKFDQAFNNLMGKQ